MAAVRKFDRPFLLQGEIILLYLTAGVALAAVLSSVLGGQPVDWLGFAPPMLGGLMLIVVGGYVRQTRGMERLALLLIGTSIYLTFGAFVAIFIFMFFPVSNVPIDAALMRIDALVGYNWAGLVEAVATVPYLGPFLALIYLSSLWQLLAVIALLAILRREADLHRFILTGALALLGTLFIWTLWPSFGPATLMAVSPEAEAATMLVVDQAYGARLMQFASQGIPVITPDTIIGAIAFPSYHTVMMCLVVWYSRRTPVFWWVLALNVPMLPAILVHGGHHAIDMAGGIAIFAVCAVITRWVVNPARSSPTFRHIPV